MTDINLNPLRAATGVPRHKKSRTPLPLYFFVLTAVSACALSLVVGTAAGILRNRIWQRYLSLKNTILDPMRRSVVFRRCCILKIPVVRRVMRTKIIEGLGNRAGLSGEFFTFFYLILMSAYLNRGLSRKTSRAFPRFSCLSSGDQSPVSSSHPTQDSLPEDKPEHRGLVKLFRLLIFRSLVGVAGRIHATGNVAYSLRAAGLSLFTFRLPRYGLQTQCVISAVPGLFIFRR